jgi:hypothetical protein
MKKATKRAVEGVTWHEGPRTKDEGRRTKDQGQTIKGIQTGYLANDYLYSRWECSLGYDDKCLIRNSRHLTVRRLLPLPNSNHEG